MTRIRPRRNWLASDRLAPAWRHTVTVLLRAHSDAPPTRFGVGDDVGAVRSLSRAGTRPAGYRSHHGNLSIATEVGIMLKWALFFAIVAVVAGLLGFSGIAAGAAVIAKFLFFVFVVLCVVFLLIGLFVAKRVAD
jgi:uncharacterized membrane protein YtjA (UPF0391 family)